MKIKFVFFISIINVLSLVAQDIPFQKEERLIPSHLRKSYDEYESINIELTKDSSHIGYWGIFSKNIGYGYLEIYSKNDSLFISEYQNNKQYRDTIIGSDFFKPTSSTFQRVIKYKKINNLEMYGLINIFNDWNGIYFFLDSKKTLYEFWQTKNNIDSLVDFKYAPISSPMEIFNFVKEKKLKEANFQELCAKNDTNTIGYFYSEITQTFMFRLYTIDGRQTAIMTADGDVYRTTFLPVENGYEIKGINGGLMGSIPMVLSKDSTELSIYHNNGTLDYTIPNGFDRYYYDNWDIGICCQDSFYSLPKENTEK